MSSSPAHGTASGPGDLSAPSSAASVITPDVASGPLLLPGVSLPGGPLIVSTIGMAVPDLGAAMEAYRSTLGWGPWRVYRQAPPALTHMRYEGRAALFSFLVAGTSPPGMPSFWLCQPLEGPSLYRRLVEEGVPGPHFMTVWRHSRAESAALEAWLTERGATELMSARLGDVIEFSFLDTRALLGTIVETGSGRSAEQPLEATYP